MNVTIRRAEEDDLPGILEIHNDAVLNTTAIWSWHAADIESRRAVLRERRAKNYPFLVAVLEGEVIGYGSFGDFRPWEGYAHTVEHSVYVHRHHHGKGIGKQLMAPLVEAAAAAGKHVMIAGIEASNRASIHFHRNFGFVEVGHLREVGRKFDRWLDLVFMQKTLEG